MNRNILTFLLILLLPLPMITVSIGCQPSVSSPAPITPAQPSASPQVPPPLITPTPKPTPVPKEVELKYDNDKPYEFMVSVNGGFLVNFKAPAAPFTIQKIRAFGSSGITDSAGRKFEIEIWDKDRKVLYKEAYPFTKFPASKQSPTKESLASGASWVEVGVPDTKVEDTFYIHLWNGSSLGGIHLGADGNIKNEHSDITVHIAETTKEIEKWGRSDFCLCWLPYNYFNGDKSKVNWMIRVVGTYLDPGR